MSLNSLRTTWSRRHGKRSEWLRRSLALDGAASICASTTSAPLLSAHSAGLSSWSRSHLTSCSSLEDSIASTRAGREDKAVRTWATLPLTLDPKDPDTSTMMFFTALASTSRLSPSSRRLVEAELVEATALLLASASPSCGATASSRTEDDHP